MFKIIFTFIILLLLSACSSHSLEKQSKHSNKALFAQEDYYILVALRAEELKNHKLASKLFSKLYKKTKRKEYIHRSLQNALFAKEYKNTIQKVALLIEKNEEDFIILRTRIVALVELEKLSLAKKYALELLNLSLEESDYLLLSDVLLKQKNYTQAIKYLEQGYQQNYSQKIIQRITSIMYEKQQRKKEAIQMLEKHSQIHTCSAGICLELASLYSKENNLDGLLQTYLRFYNIKKDSKIANKIEKIYLYNKQYIQLAEFLENSKSDDITLLSLYANLKHYKKAYKLADKLYIKTGDINYLGQSAIYNYENIKDKNNIKTLNSIVNKLNEVIEKKPLTLYLNYLGYLLIDHELDIDRGIKLVNDALKEEPKSIYFLDSLAWGYYKKGQCDKAQKLINKVITLDGDNNDEVSFHLQKIQTCTKIKQKVIK